jgi:glycosyltransferase
LSGIALITPNLNSAGTLEACIQSVASQSRRVSHLLIDGGSQDGSLAIAARHHALFQSVSSAPDQGVFDALNKGILRSEGEIVGILHADDLFADDQVIEHVSNAFCDPQVDAVYGDLDYVDRVDTDRIVRHWKAGPFSPTQFYHGWKPPHPTFLCAAAVSRVLVRTGWLSALRRTTN